MKLSVLANRVMRETLRTALVICGRVVQGCRIVRRQVSGPHGHKVLHFILKYRILAFAGGLTVMYGAACLAECCPHGWSERTWECYFVWPLHATGLIPVLKPFEALWGMLTAEAESEGVNVATEVVKESVGEMV